MMQNLNLVSILFQVQRLLQASTKNLVKPSKMLKWLRNPSNGYLFFFKSDIAPEMVCLFI